MRAAVLAASIATAGPYDHQRMTSGSVSGLETERLLIRPWQLKEAARMYDLYRRDDVVRWLGAPPMASQDQAVAMIRRNQERLTADPTYGSWAIIRRDTGVPVGSIILKPLPNGNGEVEIGWQLHPDSQGHGYATEAASAVLHVALRRGLAEVWAVTMLDNEPSTRVCERIGMRLLGVTERWYDQPSLMFWMGANARQQPSVVADRPADR